MKKSKFKKIFVVALFFAVIGIVSILNVPQIKAADSSATTTPIIMATSTPSLPDLIIENFKYTSNDINYPGLGQGLTDQIEFDIKNIGTTTPKEVFEVMVENLTNNSVLYKSDFGGAYFLPNSYSSHSYVINVLNKNLLVIGENKIKITIDVNDSIKESNENNNTLEKTIAIKPVLTVISPTNGGEKWPIGSTQTIKWLSNASSTDKVNVYLYNESSVIPALPTLIGLLTPNDGSENWTVPSYLVPGDKYRIEIKKANNSLISDKSDAVFSIVATSTLPDLTISDLSTSVESGKTYLKIKINNSGATTTNGQIISVKVKDTETGDIYSSGYSNSLAGSVKIVSAQPLVVKTSGTYKLRATIDYADIISESNENNNTLEKTITISRPDLIVKSITENTANNSINIVIKNIGVADADITNSIVRVIYGSSYYNKIENCNPDNIACLTVNRKRVDEYNASINAGFLRKTILAPKEEYSILFNKPNYLLQEINFKPGSTYLIKTYVDQNNGVVETNEKNNSLSKTVRVARVLSVKLRKK